jgi:demethylmenaquinone methyltransferase/2-methoxy-6-polyprenyl-1,4-benzoquinol methylase
MFKTFRAMQDSAYVHGAFSRIAKRYVLTNHVLSMGIDVLWRRRVARMVARYQPSLILDVATGSGDLARSVNQACPAATVVGADFCLPMLKEAKLRGLENLVVADGTRLPFDDNSFDALTVGFGLRNMASWPGALAEMSRVVRSGGPVVVLDFSLPKPPLAAPYRFYLHQVLPRVAGFLTGEQDAYRYLSGSIEEFPSGEAMLELFRKSGLEKCRCRRLSGGIASIYLGEVV